MVEAELPVFLDPQDTESHVHHRDFSCFLFYCLHLHDHGYVAFSSKKPQEIITLHTVLLFEAVMGSLTGSLIFVR